jgi:hypothetical protein
VKPVRSSDGSSKLDSQLTIRLTPSEGTREIRVILYAKDDPFCETASADELSIEDILAVEHDIIPLNGADVFQQGGISLP